MVSGSAKNRLNTRMMWDHGATEWGEGPQNSRPNSTCSICTLDFCRPLSAIQALQGSERYRKSRILSFPLALGTVGHRILRLIHIC